MPASALVVRVRRHHTGASRPGRIGASAAFVLALTAGSLAVLALAIRLLHGGSLSSSLEHAWVFIEVAASLVYATVGALLVRRGGARLIGWLFLGIAACYSLSAAAAEYGSHGLYYAPGSLPAAGAVSSLQSWIWMPANVALATVVPALLPHGRFRGPRWRILGWLSVLALLLMLPTGLTNPWPWPFGPPASPLGIAHEGWQRVAHGLNAAGALLAAVIGPAAIVSVVLQRRDASRAERPALTWLLVGSVAVVLPHLFGLPGLFVDTFDHEPLDQVLQLAALPLLPTATLVAILRHRLWGAEVVVRRALIGGLVTGAVVGIYAVAVAITEPLVGAEGFLSSALAAGGVALAFQPVRQRVQRHVNQLFYGSRHDPDAVIRSLGELVERPVSPDATLDSMARTLRTDLQLGGVVLERMGPAGPRVVARSGSLSSGADDLVLPLRSHGQHVGWLRVSPAIGDRIDERLTKALQRLAPQISPAVQAAGLLRDLQHSNERLVLAREDERQRLHRDLHDGLGPALAGVALGVQAADNRLVAGRADEARALLSVWVAEIERCVRDVRSIVEGLRPPALDELGLLGAIREHVARYADAGVPVTVDAGSSLPAMPAAVEVAAYHVVREALTNVVRHAGADAVVVVLRSGDHDRLRVEVNDDGIGIRDTTGTGVGLNSMRERVASTGGRFEIRSRGGGGTSLVAVWEAAG